MNDLFTAPTYLLLTEEDFMPSQEVLTRNQLTEEEYQQALRDDGCYDLDDQGNSFYDEE